MDGPNPNRGRGRGGRGGGRGQPQPCFSCGKLGHLQRDCPTGSRPPLNPAQSPVKKNNNNKKPQCEHESGKGTEVFSGDINQYVPANKTVACGFIDTHIHWEYIFEKFKIQGEDHYNRFIAKNKVPANFEGSISIFCDAASVSSFGIWPDLILNDNVWGAFGCHPHNAKYYTEGMRDKIIEALNHPKAVAWGECGLDFKKKASPQDVQKTVFADQCANAVKCGKPLIVHSRDAEAETLQILKDNLPAEWRIHIHCFCDTAEHAALLLNTFPNLYIGVTGSLTFTSSNALRETIKNIVPLNRILFETDGPYMTPEPFGPRQVCYSGLIPLIAQKVAELKELTLEEVYLQVRQNTNAMYGI